MNVDVLSAITARHCKRAFVDRPVPMALLQEVLVAAAHAPSSRNTQLWQVAVVTGAARDRLAARLCADFDADVPLRADYVNRPPTLARPYLARAEAAGAGVLAAKGIARDDAAARRAHQRDNYRFYGAPVAMILHLPADAAPGTFLDLGFFLQNLMLGLVACQLGSCPQYSVAGYSERIRSELGIGADRLIVCSLAVGYPDPHAPVNAFVPARAELAEYTHWYE
ncbi:MAG TPA: nitroreductase [Kofleriaceae bacterium]|nr:nitroreductase [Kofleriaceae bacterium]